MTKTSLQNNRSAS